MKRFLLLLLCASASISYAGTTDYSAQQEPMPMPTAHEEMHEAMNSMCKGMGSIKMTGSLDHDFLLMMIPHHQSALEMAQAYLKEGKTPEIKAAAEKIIEAQKKEIEEYQLWLNQHPINNHTQPHQ